VFGPQEFARLDFYPQEVARSKKGSDTTKSPGYQSLHQNV